jgi:predicted CopG family antitoxin
MNDDKFRTVTMSSEVYEKLDKLRDRKRKVLGVADLSWNNFLTTVTPAVQESIEAAEKKHK